MGDSPPRPGRPGHVERAPEAFQDIQDAIEALAGWSPDESVPDGVAPAVLVGLCSGAYQALDSGIDLWTTGAIAVNPVLRFPPPEGKNGTLHASTDPGPTRRRVSARGLQPAARLEGPPPGPQGLHGGVPPCGPARRPPLLALGDVITRHRRTCASADDQEADALFEGNPPPGGAPRRAGPARLVEIIEDLDHGLIPGALPRQVGDLMTTHLVERLPPRHAAPAHRGGTGADSRTTRSVPDARDPDPVSRRAGSAVQAGGPSTGQGGAWLGVPRGA